MKYISVHRQIYGDTLSVPDYLKMKMKCGKQDIVFMSLIKDKQIFNQGDKWDCLNRPFETKADVSEIYSFGIYIYNEK